MKISTLIAVLVALFTSGSAKADCRTVEVCDVPQNSVVPVPKRIVKKKVAKTKKVIVLKHKTIETVKAKSVVLHVVTVEKDPSFILGGRAAIGLGAMSPNTEGLLGLRAHFLPLHLGAEVSTSFDYGWATQVLVYPYQGKRLSVHVNTGVLSLGKTFLSTQDVPRTWDLTLGAGVEYKLFKHLSLTGDYRLALPSFVYMAEHSTPVRDEAGNQVYGQAGRYLNVGNVVGNSIGAGHFMIGLMLHN